LAKSVGVKPTTYKMGVKVLNSDNEDVKQRVLSGETSISVDDGLNIDTIRRLVGQEDERTTYGNYCYDRRTNKQVEEQLENALCMKEIKVFTKEKNLSA